MRRPDSNHTSAVIVAILAILLLSPLLTYALVRLAGRQRLLPAAGSADAWIGLAGSVIGGTVTMVALYFTIRQSQRDSRETAERAIKPYIYCRFSNYDPSLKQLFIPGCINNYGFIEWQMVNATDNLANGLRIVDERSYIRGPDGQFIRDDAELTRCGISIFTLLIEDSVFLPPRGTQAWRTNFCVETKDDGSYKWDGSSCMFRQSITFAYSDALGSREYCGRFEYTININIDTKNNLHFFLWDSSSSVTDGPYLPDGRGDASRKKSRSKRRHTS